MKPQVLKGFRDYAPEEMVVRQGMMDKVRAVFESFGFMPLHTPALEYAELLLGKYGDEGEKLLYKFEDQGGRMVALRYDLTVPLARFVGMNPNLRFPFRRYHIAPVWRAERPQKGRFREFYQCDVDVVGVDSPQADAEPILVDCAVLEALGLSDFRVQVNHRGFLDGLLDSLSVPREKVVPVLRVLDKVDKITRDEMAALLVQEGMQAGQVERLVGLSMISGANDERLAQALELAGRHPKAQGAVERLGKVLRVVEASHPGAPVWFTPSVARGLDYYTGIVYETFLPPQYGVGSVMSGGRYDQLLGTFAGREIPAVGISLGIDRLVAALSSQGGATGATVTGVLVCCMEGTETQAASVAAELRRGLGGRGVELYPEPARMKKQLEYADKAGIPVIVVLGQQELETGTAAVKSLRTGTQERVALSGLAAHVAGLLEAR
jgi:histidyl-tRNA synthetase